jgi:acetyltransferase-like isoleucine patch superfamily enzyme
MIDSGFIATAAVELGDYIHIAPYTTATGGSKATLKLGNFCGISTGSRLVCATDDFSDGSGFLGPTVPDKYRANLTFAPIVFEDFAVIGTNVVVLPGVTLGEGSLVGANSLVTKDTKPWTLYHGNPAKPIKKIPNETILRYAAEMGYR